MISTIIDIYKDNLLIAILTTLVVIFILFRLFKTAKIYLGAKSYVKKSKKLRKKKYSGIILAEKIQKKRKKNTNCFSKLSRRGKNLVRKYFNYKYEELPVITKYAHGKLLKRSHNTLQLLVRNDKKVLMKAPMKKGVKKLIDITNKFMCLDEVITYLHNLPEAILAQQDYDILIGDEGISFGYKIS